MTMTSLSAELLEPPDEFNFPFQPYEIQQSLMRKLYEVLARKKIGIFESPTGTGKSLSLICATLIFLKNYEEQTKNDLRSSIDVLNCEILSSFGKAADWIEEQYEIIQKKQQLFQLESKLKGIEDYNKKISDIRNKIEERSRRFLQKKVEETDDQLIEEDENENEIDDFVLPDVDSESDDDEIEEESSEFKPLQVFFCSRTHSQLTQLVGEVKSTTYSKDIRSVSLASRQNYCINKSVTQLRNNNLINERCLDLQKSKTKITKKDSEKNVEKSQKLNAKSCPFFKKNLEKLRNLSLSKVMDIEELVKAGTDEKSCPYYSSRAAVSDSQLIFVPYQILLSKTTREQCGINLKDNIVIIDEAHNLMDTISQIHTSTVTLEQLRICNAQLLNYKMKYMKRFLAKNLLKFNQLIYISKQLTKFLEAYKSDSKSFELHEILSDTSIYNINLFEILKFCEMTRFAQKIHGYSKIHEKLEEENKRALELKSNATRNLLIELQEKTKNKSKKDVQEIENQDNLEKLVNNSKPNVIRIVLQFVECLLQKHSGGRILVTKDEATKQVTMKYLLLDPSSPFEAIIKECRSIVLAGGTMKPTDELTDQLFKNCKDRVEIHSFNHVVPRKSILPIALSKGSSGKELLFTHVNKNCDAMINETSSTIGNICKIVPGGIVCFFTSYDNLNRFYNHLNDKKIIDTIKLSKDVYVEPRNSSQTEKILDDYAKSVKTKKGAIIFSVIGGKLSEGMNFSDDLGRCVIVVGLPFPNKSSPELVEKMKFITNNVNASAASEYYENLCMKAVNQSIGRSIRHIDDYATVLLLDSRYHRQNIIEKLPDWIKQNLVIANSYGKVHGEIAKFFREIKN